MLDLAAAGLGFGDVALFAVSSIQGRQIACDAGVHLLHALGDLGQCEVLVSVVDRFELAAVDRHDRLGEQVEPAAKLDELTAHRSDGRTIVATEVGDGLEVRRQASGEPHQLDIALGLPFKAAAGLDPIKIAVEVDLQKCRRMIGGSGLGESVTCIATTFDLAFAITCLTSATFNAAPGRQRARTSSTAADGVFGPASM